MALTDWLQVLMLFICAGLLFASDGGRSKIRVMHHRIGIWTSESS